MRKMRWFDSCLTSEVRTTRKIREGDDAERVTNANERFSLFFGREQGRQEDYSTLIIRFNVGTLLLWNAWNEQGKWLLVLDYAYLYAGLQIQLSGKSSVFFVS